MHLIQGIAFYKVESLLKSLVCTGPARMLPGKADLTDRRTEMRTDAGTAAHRLEFSTSPRVQHIA